ncbi:MULTISPECIES: quinoprotein relay system zinc metallohydrolase 1 [unclassified Neptuniibacter]|uniref:quinoprotein relay system zinc metallohydrolase 1 n=1 Tax=unclassified Neptuniibacter TaxID=2630693 RepID=UPI000C530237|nr:MULTISPECIES: quinoprotein relay system zinc metallohydrolase 1 [unclassified Neptuniibacter]MAY42057.1 MBL fold metallo-hydrolase [Oceanospirillaceae bacterium]|tara:strand:+ start:8860 stop:9786 length:927 start_codon:yes stop_codon:yes gene_type:complete
MFNKKALTLSLLLSVNTAAVAAPLTYDLKPQKIAENTWVLKGALEDFSRKNGGNIVNTGFVVTEEGVLVIDTGPSLKYGEEMKAAIAEITDKPIKYVLNTHSHPDHFLGNQAFSNSDILALPKTNEQLALHGDAFAGNMYRLVGDWMRSTEVKLPTQDLKVDKLKLGSHQFSLMSFTGHTGSDLVVYDRKTGVLFASDMVFFQRALTTPHTPGLDVWFKEIEKLEAIDYKVIVPGHGPVSKDKDSLKQMKRYLLWLDETLIDAAQKGLSMTEVIRIPINEVFPDIKLTRHEFIRTVAHLYPLYEDKYF